MRSIVSSILLMLAILPAFGAEDPPNKDSKEKPKKEEPTPAAKEFKAINEELGKAQQAAVKAYQEAKTDEERKKIIADFRKKPQEFAGRLLALAKKYPTDKVAFEALGFVVSASPEGPDADQAVNLLIEQHGEKLAALGERLSASPSPGVSKLLQAAVDKASNDKDKANALYNLAANYKNRAEAEGVKAPEATTLNKRAEDTFAVIVEKYKDLGKVVDRARRELFELRNLAVGKVAPDISGEDEDGKKFKLTDYRGKVVVLDFWANW